MIKNPVDIWKRSPWTYLKYLCFCFCFSFFETRKHMNEGWFTRKRWWLFRKWTLFHLSIALKLHVHDWRQALGWLSQTDFQLNKPVFIVFLELETLRVTHHYLWPCQLMACLWQPAWGHQKSTHGNTVNDAPTNFGGAGGWEWEGWRSWGWKRLEIPIQDSLWDFWMKSCKTTKCLAQKVHLFFFLL